LCYVNSLNSALSVSDPFIHIVIIFIAHNAFLHSGNMSSVVTQSFHM